MANAIVVGANSEIGHAVSVALSESGWSVVGTVREVENSNTVHLVAVVDQCDLNDASSVDAAAIKISQLSGPWDALIMAPGTMEPIGLFQEVDSDVWAQAVNINFVNQARLVQKLLSFASQHSDREPIVVFFAGGGTNSAPVGFSAYVLSKIALTKLTELLDAECPDIRFCIVGPGWVKTKIHDQVRNSSKAPFGIKEETERRLDVNDFITMDEVVKVIMWALAAPKSVIGGRNISVEHDPIHQKAFEIGLAADPDLLKLRRSGNNYSWLDRA